jgi:hypothetical protein
MAPEGLFCLVVLVTMKLMESWKVERDMGRFWPYVQTMFNGKNLTRSYSFYVLKNHQAGSIITTSLRPIPGIMVSKGNHPQMAFIQMSEI